MCSALRLVRRLFALWLEPEFLGGFRVCFKRDSSIRNQNFVHVGTDKEGLVRKVLDPHAFGSSGVHHERENFPSRYTQSLLPFVTGAG